VPINPSKKVINYPSTCSITTSLLTF